MNGPQTVLALEFRGMGETTGDFGFLAQQPGSAPLVRIDPLVHHLTRPLELQEQAELVLRDAPAPVAMVLTYCGTAALGLRVAALADAPVVLVDPYLVTDRDVHRDFARLCVSAGIGPPEAGGFDLPRWEALLLSSRDAMAETHGGDELAYELVDDLLARYRAWLRFLRASLEAVGPVAASRTVTVLTARTAEHWAPLLPVCVEPRLHRVPGDRGILDTPEARALLKDLVRSS
ncbi:hypothetical protein [Streptomyces sp. rh34]|uniref:hypothetical protein n=1 Tax=Streptomyces sp. rh34 TaxID=2034272 RepID=UPI000BF097FD|nr:hypothetical protein [Streptomyces sp. rh34]